MDISAKSPAEISVSIMAKSYRYKINLKHSNLDIDNIDAIILAAGNSKDLEKITSYSDFNSTLLITHVVSEICKSKLRNIIVITGKDHVKIKKLLKNLEFKL